MHAIVSMVIYHCVTNSLHLITDVLAHQWLNKQFQCVSGLSGGHKRRSYLLSMAALAELLKAENVAPQKMKIKQPFCCLYWFSL